MKNCKRMRVSELKTEMRRVEDAMRSAIVKDYPGLLQWLLPPPHWKPTKAKMLRWLEEAPGMLLTGSRRHTGSGLGMTGTETTWRISMGAPEVAAVV
jgi:hypothetical protein